MAFTETKWRTHATQVLSVLDPTHHCEFGTHVTTAFASGMNGNYEKQQILSINLTEKYCITVYASWKTTEITADNASVTVGTL